MRQLSVSLFLPFLPLLASTTKYTCLLYDSSEELKSKYDNYSPGSLVEATSGHSMFLAAVIGGNLTVEGDAASNSYSALKLSVPTRTDNEQAGQ